MLTSYKPLARALDCYILRFADVVCD